MFQNACKEAMELWGYRMAHNATHMASKEFYPIENYTVTEWTIQYVAMEQWFVTWRIKPNSHFVSIVYTIYFWLQFVMCSIFLIASAICESDFMKVDGGL